MKARINQFLVLILIIIIPNKAKCTDFNNDSIKCLLILKEFAEEYTTKVNIPATLPIVNEEVKNSIIFLNDYNPKECNKYLTLILLKVYKSHLQIAHQAYDLRSKEELKTGIENIILITFLKMTKYYDITKPIEFISSEIALKWVDNNQQMLKYKPINKEYKNIKKINKNIKMGKYW